MTPRRLTLRRVRLCEVWHCAESHCTQTNTGRNFAGINFVFAGLSLPWKRMLNLKKKIYVNYFNIHRPTSCVNFLKGRLSKKLTLREFIELKIWISPRQRIVQQNRFRNVYGPRLVQFIANLVTLSHCHFVTLSCSDSILMWKQKPETIPYLSPVVVAAVRVLICW